MTFDISGRLIVLGFSMIPLIFCWGGLVVEILSRLAWDFVNREYTQVDRYFIVNWLGELSVKIFDKIVIVKQDEGYILRRRNEFYTSQGVWRKKEELKAYRLSHTKEEARDLLFRLSEEIEPCLNFLLAPLLWACVFAGAGAALVYVPQVFLFVAGVIGTLFVLRWMMDIQKYATKLKEKLDIHMQDKDAHK